MVSYCDGPAGQGVPQGAGLPGGGAGKNHFRIALGSAAEVCAVLDLVQSGDAAYFQRRLRRIGAMLARMSK